MLFYMKNDLKQVHKYLSCYGYVLAIAYIRKMFFDAIFW